MKKSRLTTLLTTTSAVTLALALGAPSANAEEMNSTNTLNTQHDEITEITALNSEETPQEVGTNVLDEESLEVTTLTDEESLEMTRVEENSEDTEVPSDDVTPEAVQHSYSQDYTDQEVEDYLANYGNVNQEVSPYAKDQAQYINDLRAEKNEAIDNGTAKEKGVANTKYYAPKVQVDDDLSKIAHWKARDMALNGYFSHDTPDGQKVKEQLDEAYKALGKKSPYSYYGENIAMGSAVYNDKDLSKNLFDRWYKSAGHRKNMESPLLTHVGYGTYADPLTGYTYGVQIFGGMHKEYLERTKNDKNPNLPKGKVAMKDFENTYEKGSLRRTISGEYASNDFPLKMENPKEYKRVPFVTGEGNKDKAKEKPSTPPVETPAKTDKNGNKLTELAKVDDYGYSITTSLDVTDENKPYIDKAVKKVKKEMAKHANDLRSHGINYDAFVEKFPFEVNLVSIKDLPNAGRYYTRFDGPNRTNPVGILELAVSPKKNHITHMLVTHEFSHHTGFRWVHAPSRDHFDKIREVIDLDATVSENERRPKWKNSNVEKYGEAYTQAFVEGHSNRSATGNLTDEEIIAFIELVKNEMNKVGGAPVENDKETDNNEQTQQPSEDNNKDKDHLEKPSDDNKDEESTETTDKDSNKDDISDVGEEDDSKENTPTPSENEDLDNNTDENITTPKDKEETPAVDENENATPPVNNEGKDKETDVTPDAPEPNDLEKDNAKTLPDTGIVYNETLSLGVSLLAMLSGLILVARRSRKESK